MIKRIKKEISKKKFFAKQKDLYNCVLTAYENGDMEYVKIFLSVIIENAVDRVKNNVGRPLSIQECKDYYGFHFTLDHQDKMAGMVSASTTCLHNEYCSKYRQIDGAICQKCFSANQQSYMKSMVKPLLFNSLLLQNVIIPDILLPLINALYFRFESFGDLGNETQYINYMNICKKNPCVHFALFTKNPFIIARAIESGYKKPENCTHLLSSLYVNTAYTWDFIHEKKWDFIDKVFTVYDSEEEAEAHGEKINCGKRHCLSCTRCYHKDTDRNVNEIVK